jgi:hypothetical protein
MGLLKARPLSVQLLALAICLVSGSPLARAETEEAYLAAGELLTGSGAVAIAATFSVAGSLALDGELEYGEWPRRHPRVFWHLKGGLLRALVQGKTGRNEPVPWAGYVEFRAGFEAWRFEKWRMTGCGSSDATFNMIADCQITVRRDRLWPYAGIAAEAYDGLSLVVPVGARLQWSGRLRPLVLEGLKGYLDAGLRFVVRKPASQEHVGGVGLIPGAFVESALGGVGWPWLYGLRGEITGMTPKGSSTPEFRAVAFVGYGSLRDTETW